MNQETPPLVFPSKEFYDIFKKVPGAISCGESACIAHLASQVPEGLCIDIGTNAGRAAMSAANGLARRGIIQDLQCIDPVFDLSNAHAISQMCQKTVENIGWDWVREPDFQEKVRLRIHEASDGVVTPRFHGLASMDALPILKSTGGKVAWAFVDADNHQYDLVHAECMLLKDFMEVGGIIAFHDFQNQYLDVEKVYNELYATGMFEPMVCPWPEINDHIEKNVGEWDGNISWHACENPHPTFVGALRYTGRKNP